MSEKKVVSRNLAIELGIVCIILTAGLVKVITDNNSQITSLNNNMAAKDSQISELQTWLDGNLTLLSKTQDWLDGNITYYKSAIEWYDPEGLLSMIDSLRDEIYSLNAQIDALQSQVSNPAAKLIGVNLIVKDNRTVFESYSLHVDGYVCNVGTTTAQNAVLYVEAWQGFDLAFNETISLGTINGENYVFVDSQINYIGDALTIWRVWSNPAGININWQSTE